MSRLETSKNFEPRLCCDIIKLVTAARRPLSLDELNEALSVEPGTPEWDKNRLFHDMRRTILASCGSLVTVDEEHLTVQYAHHSVRQHFLTQDYTRAQDIYHTSAEEANDRLGQVCVTYLSFSDFEMQLAQSRQLRLNAASIPHEIIQRALPSRSKTSSIALKLLRKSRKAPAIDISGRVEISAIRNELPRSPEYSRHHFLDYAQQNWLFHTSNFDIDHLGVGIDPQSKCSALFTCLIRGGRGSVDVSSLISDAFSILMEFDHRGIVVLLIEEITHDGPNLSAMLTHFSEFLSWAVRRGRVQFFEQLFKQLARNSGLLQLHSSLSNTPTELIAFSSEGPQVMDNRLEKRARRKSQEFWKRLGRLAYHFIATENTGLLLRLFDLLGVTLMKHSLSISSIDLQEHLSIEYQVPAIRIQQRAGRNGYKTYDELNLSRNVSALSFAIALKQTATVERLLSKILDLSRSHSSNKWFQDFTVLDRFEPLNAGNSQSGERRARHRRYGMWPMISTAWMESLPFPLPLPLALSYNMPEEDLTLCVLFEICLRLIFSGLIESLVRSLDDYIPLFLNEENDYLHKIVDERGWTVLHYAVAVGNYNVVDRLMRRGARLDYHEPGSLSARSIAREIHPNTLM